MTFVSTCHILLTPTQPVGTGETMTSVSVGHILLTPTQPVGSGETMTSVSAGHILLTPTQPVKSGGPELVSNPWPSVQTELAPPPPHPICFRMSCVDEKLFFFKLFFISKRLESWTARYIKPGLQAEKKRNITVTDCLVILYSAWKQSAIAVFFLHLWRAQFFAACSPAFVYLGP